MTSSGETGGYRKKVEESPIRVDHVLIGERKSEGSSVDGTSHENIAEHFKGPESSKTHPLCALLNFTTEGGDTVSHPAFGEETVWDLCVRELGREYDHIFRLN